MSYSCVIINDGGHLLRSVGKLNLFHYQQLFSGEVNEVLAFNVLMGDKTKNSFKFYGLLLF